MKKQTLSRGAALLSASALTLGLAATAAAAAEATPATRPVASAPAPAPTGGVFTPGTGRAKNRKIERLIKALALARAERADAYDTVAATKDTLTNTAPALRDAETALAAATEPVPQAKADLTEARTRLVAARIALADATDLYARNKDDQDAAATALQSAQDLHDTATATVADLTVQIPNLIAAHDAAVQAVVDAETEIAWLTNTTIPQATTDA